MKLFILIRNLNGAETDHSVIRNLNVYAWLWTGEKSSDTCQTDQEVVSKSFDKVRPVRCGNDIMVELAK